jgi:hypothetical protein
MRRRTLMVTGLVALILVIGSLPAAAYVDVGYDPQGDSDGGAYDIRSTVRSVVQEVHGRSLRVAIRTYEAAFAVGSWVYVDVRLDARDGRAADAIMHMWIADMSGSGCRLETRSGRVLKKGTFRIVDYNFEEDEGSDTVSCRVPVRPLHPTKTIRWKVSTIYANGEPVFDTAPNVGMYS